MNPEDIILEPIFTEKAQLLKEKNEYCFKVHKDATKPEIKKAAEKLFNVKVKKVKVVNIKPKKKMFLRREGKKPGFKKAILTLEKGYKLELEK